MGEGDSVAEGLEEAEDLEAGDLGEEDWKGEVMVRHTYIAAYLCNHPSC